MTPPDSLPTAAQNERLRFVHVLGAALQRYGAPAHRLEDVLMTLCSQWGLEGHFFSTPTALISSFSGTGLGDGEQGRSYLHRIPGAEINLAKLADLDVIFNEAADGDVTPTIGVERVKEIVAALSPWSSVLTTFCFAATSGAAARFFGGGLPEILLAALCGLVLGLFALLTPRQPRLAHVFEPLGALLVSLTATLCAPLALLFSQSVGWGDSISADQATLGGLIVLVPGFSLTIAIAEIATRNLVSGTARLAASSMTFLMLGFGTWLGRSLGQHALEWASIGFPMPLASASPPAAWTELIVLPIAATTIGILFRAPRRELGWIFIVSALGWLSVTQASTAFGPVAGVFFGALAVGIASNLYARLLNRPASTTRLPGLLFLVPGALGFLSISTLMQGDPVEGLRSAFQVAMTSIALVTGLLAAAGFVPPRKAL